MPTHGNTLEAPKKEVLKAVAESIYRTQYHPSGIQPGEDLPDETGPGGRPIPIFAVNPLVKSAENPFSALSAVPAKFQPEVPEDDGRSLLARDQYRMELREIGKLTVSQEVHLVERARGGAKEAQTALIESCLDYILYHAWRISHRFPGADPLDIAQAGNTAIVEHMQEALRSRYVCGFLRVVAKNAMVDYCAYDKLMPVPRRSFNRGRRAPRTISLLALMRSDRDTTLLDLLEDANWQEAWECVEVSA